MWRLVALGFVGLVIAGASMMLPAVNGEEQLRSLTHIATQGSEGPRPANMALGDLTPVPNQKNAAVAAPERLATSTAVAATLSPGDIVSQLQGQLRRVGCYKGKALGQWDAATRRAMARFNDRVNARVSLDAPSPILLTLVEKYDNRACGAPCSPGTSPNASGVCVSTQIATAPSQPVPAKATAVAAAALVAAQPTKANSLSTSVSTALKTTPQIIASQPAAAPMPAIRLASKAAEAPTKPVATTMVATAAQIVIPNNGNAWAPTVVVAPPETARTRVAMAAPVVAKPVMPVLALAKVETAVPKVVVAPPDAKSTALPAASTWAATSQPAGLAASPTVALAMVQKSTVQKSVEPVPEPLDVAQVLPAPVAGASSPVQVEKVKSPKTTRVAKRATAKRTTVALVDSPRKKRYARKSSGSGNTLYAFGGPVRRHKSAPASLFTFLFGSQMFVSSNRFVAPPRPQRSLAPPVRRSYSRGGGGGGGNGELQIVLSNH